VFLYPNKYNREISNEDSMFLMFDDESDGSSDSEDEIYYEYLRANAMKTLIPREHK